MRSQGKATVNGVAMLLAICFIGLAQAVDNCFFSGQLAFTNRGSDPNGNFSNVEEYRMKKNKNCSFVQDTGSKLSWYSTDIKVYYALAYQKNDGQGCHMEQVNANNMKLYKKGTVIEMGKQQLKSSE